MNKPLYLLAAEGSLPLHQQVDPATLKWIQKNNPFLDTPPQEHSLEINRADVRRRLSLACSETIRIYETIELPFVRENAYDTLHGTLHAMRVALLAGVLSRQSMIPAIFAGLLHDVARVNDSADEGHGLRSSDIAKEFFSITQTEITLSEIEEIIDAIQLHEEEGPGSPGSLPSVVRVADALDRYRLPKLKWWPIANKMPFHPDPIFFQVAYRLVVDSERESLMGKPYATALQVAVHNICKELAR